MQDLERLIGFAGGDVTSFSRTAAASCWGSMLIRQIVGMARGLSPGIAEGEVHIVKCGTKACALPIETGFWSEYSGDRVWLPAAAVPAAKPCFQIVSLGCASVAWGRAIPSTVVLRTSVLLQITANFSSCTLALWT